MLFLYKTVQAVDIAASLPFRESIDELVNRQVALPAVAVRAAQNDITGLSISTKTLGNNMIIRYTRP